MTVIFFIVLCCITSDSFASTDTLDLIQQNNDPHYPSRYWAWNEKDESLNDIIETDALDLNEDKNETDALYLNEDKNETNKLNLNEDKNETNTQNLNEDDNENDSQNNEQENVTATLTHNEQENLTNAPNLNADKNDLSVIDLVKRSSPNTCACSAPSFFNYKIIGGFYATDDVSFPYQALFYVDGSACGATILNRRYLLSAMHCVYNPHTGFLRHPSEVIILVGTNKFAVAGGDVLSAIEFIPHPEYIHETQTNDILIIKVQEDIEFSSTVKPACLPTSRWESFVGRDATVSGWGATVGYENIPPYDPGFPHTLKHTTVRVLDPRDRRCAADSLRDPVTKLCAYTFGTDACQGDSGGPLVVVEGGVHTIIGVVSYGFGCAAWNHPGIYARVTNYLDWIVAVTWDGRC